ILAGSQGSEMGEASQSHQQFKDSAMASRGEIARLEEERVTLLRRLERTDGLLGRVGFGPDPADLRAAIGKVEARLRQGRLQLEGNGPQRSGEDTSELP